jgi:hypothetical protein
LHFRAAANDKAHGDSLRIGDVIEHRQVRLSRKPTVNLIGVMGYGSRTGHKGTKLFFALAKKCAVMRPH